MSRFILTLFISLFSLPAFSQSLGDLRQSSTPQTEAKMSLDEAQKLILSYESGSLDDVSCSSDDGRMVIKSLAEAYTVSRDNQYRLSREDKSLGGDGVSNFIQGNILNFRHIRLLNFCRQ